jgi:hypothetical protein
MWMSMGMIIWFMLKVVWSSVSGLSFHDFMAIDIMILRI